MGLSRQAYYQGQRRHIQRECRAEVVVQWVRERRLRQPSLGARKLHHLLGESLQLSGMSMGRDALFDVLRNAGMLVPQRRAYHKTTDSHHRFRQHPNLLKAGKQQVCATASEQVWVADITYLPTNDKFVYPRRRRCGQHRQQPHMGRCGPSFCTLDDCRLDQCARHNLTPTSYAICDVDLWGSTPRTISNLVANQSSAALTALGYITPTECSQTSKLWFWAAQTAQV